jgi:hypothetical protein
MPVHSVERGGKTVGYKYGDTGKLYLIQKWGKSEAAKKAGQQAAAIKHSQEREGRKTE